MALTIEFPSYLEDLAIELLDDHPVSITIEPDFVEGETHGTVMIDILPSFPDELEDGELLLVDKVVGWFNTTIKEYID